MRPPLAGRRAAARRLAEQVRRRLEPVERLLPITLPGFEAGTSTRNGEDPPAVATEPAAAVAPADDAAARRSASTADDDAAARRSAATADDDVAARRSAAAADDAAARIDAARARLRSEIEPPEDSDD